MFANLHNQQPSFLAQTTNCCIVLNHMDPKFKGEWSASEIKMVKSLITRDNANNKHNQIVDEL